MVPTRRQFLHTAAAGLALAAPAAAIEPIARPGKPRFRLSVAAYGYRKYLDLNLKPRPPMTLDDFVELAAAMDLDAVEPTGYYFPETSPEYLARLKGKCTRLGLDISGTATRNDFCTVDDTRRQADIAHVKKWIEYASLLGAKALRIFAGNVPRGDTEEKARARLVAALQEVCDHASRYGVYVALENHGGITATVEQMLPIVQAVKHDWFGVNLDTGNFHSADPYADLAKLAPYAVNVQIKTEMQRGKKKEDADLKALLDILRAAGYRGYVVLEYEAAEDPKTAIPRHMETLRKLL